MSMSLRSSASMQNNRVVRSSWDQSCQFSASKIIPRMYWTFLNRDSFWTWYSTILLPLVDSCSRKRLAWFLLNAFRLDGLSNLQIWFEWFITKVPQNSLHLPITHPQHFLSFKGNRITPVTSSAIRRFSCARYPCARIVGTWVLSVREAFSRCQKKWTVAWSSRCPSPFRESYQSFASIFYIVSIQGRTYSFCYRCCQGKP